MAGPRELGRLVPDPEVRILPVAAILGVDRRIRVHDPGVDVRRSVVRIAWRRVRVHDAGAGVRIRGIRGLCRAAVLGRGLRTTRTLGAIGRCAHGRERGSRRAAHGQHEHGNRGKRTQQECHGVTSVRERRRARRRSAAPMNVPREMSRLIRTLSYPQYTHHYFILTHCEQQTPSLCHIVSNLCRRRRPYCVTIPPGFIEIESKCGVAKNLRIVPEAPAPAAASGNGTKTRGRSWHGAWTGTPSLRSHLRELHLGREQR